MRYKIGIGFNHTLDRGETKIELLPCVAIIHTGLNKGIEIGWFGCHLFLGILDMDVLAELVAREEECRLQEERMKEP